MAGLASLLRARGKTAVIYSVDPIARRYKWLPLVSTTVHTIPFDERFDCTSSSTAPTSRCSATRCRRPRCAAR